MKHSVVRGRAGAAGALLVFLFTTTFLVCMLLVSMLLVSGRGLSGLPPGDPDIVTSGEQAAIHMETGGDGAGEARCRESFVIELEGAAAAEVYVAARAQAEVSEVSAAAVAATTQAHLAALEQAQQAVLAGLAGLNVQVLYRTQRVYNGIAVRAMPDQVAQMRAMPGVKAVHRLVAKAPARKQSVPYLGVPGLWEGMSSAGITGEGMRIAIIDTGVDYLHRDFAGPGEGYDTNNPRVSGDVVGFPGARVAGGYDFAGETYNANARDKDYQPVPQPDPDPMDCYGAGHGTHVAGIAAGSGVLADGTTYTGPYNDSLDMAKFLLGPGVAPRAEIYALKVFGCDGYSELVDLAIEWAVDPDQDGDFSDHMDVINLSLGSTYGATYDPATVASNNAAAIGVIVVASAGNAGDTYYTVGSPSVANGVISVAASDSVTHVLCSGPYCEDAVPDFSSRGPRRIDSFLKPDVAAPGRLIVSAGAGLGSGGYGASGTSMAAPHVAGIMLLLRQFYPDPGFNAAGAARSGWTGADLKALVMNTAVPELRTPGPNGGIQYGPARMGAGRIAVQNALRSKVIAYNADAPELVSLSFGAPDVLATYSAVQRVRVENKGAATVTLGVTYTVVTDMPGVAFSLAEGEDLPAIIVAPYGFATFPLTLTAQAEQMARVRDQTVNDTQIFPRHWLSAESGYLVLSRAGGDPALHVPVYAAPRPVAQMQAGTGGLDFGEARTGTRVVELVGYDLGATAAPTGVVSLVSFFGLHYSSPNDEPEHAGPHDAGTYDEEIGAVDLTDHADLRYVGIASDDLATEDASIYFGIATHQAWSTPNEVEFDVYIDMNGDRISDYRLFNSDQVGYDSDTQVSDAFVSVVEDLQTGALTSQRFLNGYSAAVADSYLYNSNVMVLPVSMADLGVDAGRPEIRYFVESYSKDVSNGVALRHYVERTPMFAYNVARSGVHVVGSSGIAPLYADRDGESFTIQFDRRAYARADLRGILLFHHHNVHDRRTQALAIDYTLPNVRYLPLIRAD